MKSYNQFSYIEVSHFIETGMQTYPGLPVPEAEIIIDYETSRPRYNNRAEFLIKSLHLCGNTGTYVDSPYHRFPDGLDLAALPLEHLAHLPVTVINVSDLNRRYIDPDDFVEAELTGHAVLFNTGWSRHWGTEAYFEQNPFLTAESCELLVEAEAAFVGIDSLNIDDIEDLSRPAHTKLLGAGIPICEHMTNLAAIKKTDCFLHAVPIAWVGGTTFPVRAYIMALKS